MQIKPLWDRILLKPIDNNLNTTESWLFIPESINKERPYIYEVLEVWPWDKDTPDITVNVWDKVLSGQYSWDDIKIEWEDLKIVPMKFILAIIK